MEKNMEQQTLTNMKEVIICIGISGSGKSTWTTKFIKENSNYLRINRDDIRKTLVCNLDGYYQRRDLNTIETKVNHIEDFLFDNIWGINKYPIIDNTNLKQSYIYNWIFKVNEYNSQKAQGLYPDSPILDFKFKLFDISLEDAERRVAKRENMQTFEDLNYITKQFEQYKQIKQWILNNYNDKII